MDGSLGRNSAMTVRILASAVALRAILMRLLNYLIPITAVDAASPSADLRILSRDCIDGILQVVTLGALLFSIAQFLKKGAGDTSSSQDNFAVLLVAGLLVLLLALGDSNAFIFDYVGPSIVPLLVGAAASCANNLKRRS